ncbi:predicted membrane protein [Moesziomyces antarcticus T-34]|uniref:Predicted membrane protein n=1 Tax=Pseudozyma antarctica (strain T-34) TaxID=1151754 RepID=M9LUE7_PSEA3|nr:predicted membrane protein [Moesziomyces antarcticus T-34]
MESKSTSSPASPPRLLRSKTEHPTSQSSEFTAAFASSSPIVEASDLLDTQPAAGPSAAASSSSSARKGRANRARTRSVSSNAVPVSQLSRSTLSSLQTELDGALDRGPGTPDFTLSASTPQWRRADVERDRTMSSLGQGLQLISEAETSAGPSSSNPPNRKRSASGASQASASSQSSDSHKKKSMPANSFTRPRLSTLRSFLSSFAGGNSASAPGSSSNTPHDEQARMLENEPSTSHRLSVRPQALVMPSARPAAHGLVGLNEDSPPLTPTSDPDEQSEYQQYVNAFRQQLVPKQAARPLGAPKHQWSAAQAAADAVQADLDERNRITPPALAQWPFTPPLTTSNVTSPVASSRAFSPPTRPDSTITTASAYQGILPSHLVSGAAVSSRSTTPTSSTTASGTESARTYNLFDVDTYRIESAGKTLFALLPRIQINLSSWRLSIPNVRPYLPRLIFLFVIFAASTCCIVFMLWTLPLTLPKHITSLTLAEIKQLATSLKVYSQSSPRAFVHTLVVLGTFFTWKQSFCVPGSLIMNVVFGAMYGTYSGTLYTSILTAVGGVFCYLLSAPLAPLITSLPGLAKPLDAMRRALSPGRARASERSVMLSTPHTGSNGNVWTYLLVLRVLPIVPYGLMNIACGVLGVPLVPYAGTLAVGSIPWNFVTCQVGDLLQEIVEALPVSDDTTVGGLKDKAASSAGGGMRAIVDRIWNREMVVKLILLSIASLLPIVLSRYLKYRQRQQAEAEGYQPVDANDVDDDGIDDEEADRPASRRSSRIIQHNAKTDALPIENVPLNDFEPSASAHSTVGRGSNRHAVRSTWL